MNAQRVVTSAIGRVLVLTLLCACSSSTQADKPTALLLTLPATSTPVVAAGLQFILTSSQPAEGMPQVTYKARNLSGKDVQYSIAGCGTDLRLYTVGPARTRVYSQVALNLPCAPESLRFIIAPDSEVSFNHVLLTPMALERVERGPYLLAATIPNVLPEVEVIVGEVTAQ